MNVYRCTMSKQSGDTEEEEEEEEQEEEEVKAEADADVYWYDVSKHNDDSGLHHGAVDHALRRRLRHDPVAEPLLAPLRRRVLGAQPGVPRRLRVFAQARDGDVTR